jgi:hypothetical protein
MKHTPMSTEREALTELVALKDLEEFIGLPRWNATNEEIDRFYEAREAYKRRAPSAWESARAALARGRSGQ